MNEDVENNRQIESVFQIIDHDLSMIDPNDRLGIAITAIGSETGFKDFQKKGGAEGLASAIKDYQDITKVKNFNDKAVYFHFGYQYGVASGAIKNSVEKFFGVKHENAKQSPDGTETIVKNAQLARVTIDRENGLVQVIADGHIFTCKGALNVEVTEL